MILTINCGSSTIKYQLFSTDVATVVAKGIVSRIGEEGSYFEQETARGQIKELAAVPSHHEAFEICIHNLLHPDYGAIADIHEIEAVGHRASMPERRRDPQVPVDPGAAACLSLDSKRRASAR